MRMPRLTSAQVAARLDIKLQTLYAYVARGQLAGERDETGGTTFDPLDVEAFAASRRRPAEAARQGRPLMVLDSDLALIDGDRLYFRGRLATDLAATLTFEEAVALLWAGPAGPFASSPRVVSAVRRGSAGLGSSARLLDRMALAVVIAGSWDAARDHADPREVGARLIATIVDALPDAGARPSPSAPIAGRLWAKLTERPPTADDIRLLDATMVLSMEHDLAISTVAARVAASARSNPYAAVTAALGAFDGSIHGGASLAAVDLLRSTLDSGNAEHAISTQLKATGSIPGFGHVVYRREDPRARHLLDLMRPMPAFHDVIAAADRVRAVVAARSPRPANLDLALAALVVGAGMPRDAGELLFAVSRVAGWVAHILDEYTRPALRLRPQSRYTGVVPALTDIPRETPPWPP
ncbi:MAG: Citrate synthase [Microbacteriaceae bacterium]|nr:Citrate synthase [Microbacteriaceae bacterium]